MKSLLSILGVALAFSAIATQSFAGPLVSVGGRNSIRGVYFHFNSVGTGIDGAALRQYLGLVETAKTQNLIIKETYVQKGREGEIQACVMLDASVGYQIIKALAPSIVEDRQVLGASRTEVYVGLDCENVSEATLQDLEAYL